MKLMHKTAATAAVAGMLLAGGMAAPAHAVRDVGQVGLVNVSVGNVNILRNVDVAVAANVVANICNVDVTAAVLLAAVEDNDGFTCTQRGSGRPVAVTG